MTNSTRNLYDAAGWMLLGCFVFTVFSFIIDLLIQNVNSLEILFFVSFFGLVILAPIILTNKQKYLKTTSLKLYPIRALATVFSMGLWVYMLNIIPTIDLVAISYMLPVINAFAGIMLLKERHSFARIACILLGFLGVVLILNPTLHSGFYNILLALLIPIAWSFSDVILKLQTKGENVIGQAFYLLAFTALFTLIPTLVNFDPITFQQLIALFIAGGLFLINVISIYNAYNNGDIGYVASFDFLRLVMTALICYFMLDEEIKDLTLIGASIIFISSIYSTKIEKKKILG